MARRFPHSRQMRAAIALVLVLLSSCSLRWMHMHGPDRTLASVGVVEPSATHAPTLLSAIPVAEPEGDWADVPTWLCVTLLVVVVLGAISGSVLGGIRL